MKKIDLNEFERLIKVAGEFAKKMPDCFWMPEDSEQLVTILRKAISAKTGKISPNSKPFILAADSKERFIQMNAVIENILKYFPSKLTDDQSAIIHKLYLEKALALKKK